MSPGRANGSQQALSVVNKKSARGLFPLCFIDFSRIWAKEREEATKFLKPLRGRKQ